jgi:hypothetical protein
VEHGKGKTIITALYSTSLQYVLKWAVYPWGLPCPYIYDGAVTRLATMTRLWSRCMAQRSPSTHDSSILYAFPSVPIFCALARLLLPYSYSTTAITLHVHPWRRVGSSRGKMAVSDMREPGRVHSAAAVDAFCSALPLQRSPLSPQRKFENPSRD